MIGRSRQHDWSFLDSVLAGVYTVPGDGSLDYVSVFKELRRLFTAGWWSRPSRTRRRHRPQNMPSSATTI